LIADTFADLENWSETGRHLLSARKWADKAREHMPEVAAAMVDDIRTLEKCVGRKDEWMARTEYLIPAIIDRVFETFASCIRLKGTRKALPW